MLFEEIISELGEFGPYQRRIFGILCFLSVPTAMHVLATVFIQATPAHRCALPWLSNDSYASQGPWHDAMVRASIPWREDRYDGCRISRSPGSLSNGTVQCDKWVYSEEDFQSTLVTDANLVCQDESLATYASMVMMAGMLSGSFILGILSDMIGRKTVLVLGAVGEFTMALATAWVKSYAAYVVLRFLTTFFGIGIFLSGFVIGMELVGPSKRKFVGIVIEVFWCVGLFIETGIAYGIRNWRYFQMTISAFSFVAIILFVFFVPESARWLVQKGKREQVARVLETAARENGVVLSERARSLDNVECEGKRETVWRMFTSPILLARSLIVFFNWFATSIAYYGLNFKSGDLSGNIYLNFFLMALVEMVSYPACLALLDVMGRKFLQCCSLVLGGVACIATLFPVLYGGQGGQWMTLVLALIGKFGIAAGFAINCVYSSELFPTVMRTSAMGLGSVCARLGGILAPFIGAMEHGIAGSLGVALPLLIFGGLSLTAGLLVLFLPETTNRVLPDTVEEAKNFGRVVERTAGVRDSSFTADNGIKDVGSQIDQHSVTLRSEIGPEEKQHLLRTRSRDDYAERSLNSK